MLNGGIIGTLLDCHCNWTAAWHLMNKAGEDRPPCTVTADYAIKLLRPTPTRWARFSLGQSCESTDDRATVEGTLTAGGQSLRDLPRNFRRGERRPSGVPSLVGISAVVFRGLRAATLTALAGLAAFAGQPVKGDAITRTITLSWNASSSANVLGYRVRYGTRSGQYSQVVDAGNQTTVDLPNLVKGTTYFFVVTAYNAAGESFPTDELMHTVDQAVFLNMSNRAKVESGDAVMISGFIIGGSSLKTIVVRGTGPSLAAAGINGVLADPALELHGVNGLLAENDNWRDGNPAELYRLQLTPGHDAEAALVVTLAPGGYTVILRGRNDSSGIALLEVYDAGVPGAR